MTGSRPAALIMAILLSGFAGIAAKAQPMSEALYQNLHWRQIGPFRGGWASAIEGIPDQPDLFYMGTAGGGIWRSANAGRSWAPIFASGPAAIGALAAAPSNSKILYAGTGQ